MRDYTPELDAARELMEELRRHMRAFDQGRLAFQPPVLDNATGTPWRGEDTQGLRKFTDAIEQQDAQLQTLAKSDDPPREDPLPVIQGLATAWKCLVLAATPVPAVRMSSKLPASGNQPAREGFVDVVARGGAEWIRIYSKKVSTLLAEFREYDSYLTDSDDEGPNTPKAASFQPNVLTRLVDDLLALAAGVERIPGAVAPRLTLRLTRIEENPEGGHPDLRVGQTLDAIRARGVHLVFGDLSDIPFSRLPTSLPDARTVTPSRRLNLDPTALMGLCSDLLHHPLPATPDEARARFYRPQTVVEEAGHAGGGRGSWDGAGEADAAQSQNSRELVRALLEETTEPLVEVIRDTLEATSNGQEIELWATQEAITYLQETISSEALVGEGLEQRRMRRLTGLEDGDFWEGSRYAGKAGCLAKMRLHVFDDDCSIDMLTKEVEEHGLESVSRRLESPLALGKSLCADGMTSFHATTAAACTTFVAEYLSVVSKGMSAAPALPGFLNPRRLPAPRVAQISTPFTVVALHSLSRGAAEGMTTLSMGHVVFRELFAQPRWRTKGWAQGSYELERTAIDTVIGDMEALSVDDGGVLETTPGAPVHAVTWILPYRSLGEAKRVKFAAGDYSFPRFVQRVLKDGERALSRTATPTPTV
ncbi:uncharacterized protein CcaverHIS019_0702710 [Cutaneotrichosporon cavernicola]|uniref:DUF1308 domain-containing protein n=1 Tax=Cutaneotrichosporon cavernicola TaxID=279322 RepID=A0AA48LA28_9TREE|nr:uncharacterized protein CcaverHIS019_0702710 [Cutaneotrichosporon cavernicola]BEI94690.1 hypothetical protein CcaverHIS019_0702710 [Cutaneotrichosporon cavernicola]BEJ02465.1 hypothetical protein CcaverHIS631_0702600 [Cutaneotrichosporon cavernicola]BEJ10224.1 hypothetical protein CcaverHIS641_0702590 [Cutaneotrichosporon cavernicola]